MRINRNTYRVYFTFIFFVAYGLAEAQYEGGIGDGAQNSGTVQITLNGQQINTVALYQGGFGDGHYKSNILLTLGGTDLTFLYMGSSGDGHYTNTYSGTLVGDELADLYQGGISDGHYKADYFGVLDGTELASLYSGGDSDGHNRLAFAAVLDGTVLDQLYQGGLSDGHTKESINVVMNGEVLSQLYQGGLSDGFNKDIFNGVMDGATLDGLYSGGSGDGFTKNDIQYIFTFPECTFVVNTDDDGFGSLRYAIDCASPGDTIEFSPLLMEDAINIFSNPLNVDKDLFINANPAANLTVDGTTLPNAFLTGLNGTANITIKGLDIIAGSDIMGGAIMNGSTLTLEELEIIDSDGTSVSVIANFNGGALIIKGLVQIISN